MQEFAPLNFRRFAFNFVNITQMQTKFTGLEKFKITTKSKVFFFIKKKKKNTPYFLSPTSSSLYSAFSSMSVLYRTEWTQKLFSIQIYHSKLLKLIS